MKKTPFCNQTYIRAQSITCSLIQAVGLILSNQPFRRLDNNNINLSSQQFCRSHFTCTYFIECVALATFCFTIIIIIADYCYLLKHTARGKSGLRAQHPLVYLNSTFYCQSNCAPPFNNLSSDTSRRQIYKQCVYFRFLYSERLRLLSFRLLRINAQG